MTENLSVRPRVLVVDDDPDVLNFIRGALQDEGLDVATATDGGRAIELADEFKPHLIVLDVTLPVLSGHRVAGHMRERHGASVPILVITADGQAVAKARQLGAYAYLRKPFELQQLLDQVWHGLRRG